MFLLPTTRTLITVGSVTDSNLLSVDSIFFKKSLLESKALTLLMAVVLIHFPGCS